MNNRKSNLNHNNKSKIKSSNRNNSSYLNAIKNPKKAPFKVAYEFFASVAIKNLAYVDENIKKMEDSPAKDFVFSFQSEEQAEATKKSCIESVRKLYDHPEYILKHIGLDTKNYRKLKRYFENKTKQLNITNPLIFYDDEAKRIDIGYGPKQFSALFPDFTFYGGVLESVFRLKASFFGGKSLKEYLDDFLCGDYVDNLNYETQRLLKKSEEVFKNLPILNSFFDSSKITNESEIINSLLNSHNGFVIGEYHQHLSSKLFLIENMEKLKEKGVTTIYLEHLLHEEHQALLDQYLNSPLTEPMPIVLARYLKLLDKEFELSEPATFTNIVKSAKTQGIRIVAIDTEASYRVGVCNNIHDLYNKKKNAEYRCTIMNILAAERFQQYNNGGKFVMLVGLSHAADLSSKILGVAKLLGCPNIAIIDASEKEQKISSKCSYPASNNSAKFDFLYERVPSQELNLRKGARKHSYRH